MTIAMSYFDRMLWKVVSCDAPEPCHELLAVATLYLAVKLFEKRRCNILRDFVLMSRNQLTAQQITGMESELLSMLSWHVHPTTPQLFSFYFLKLLSKSSSLVGKKYARNILEMANFIIELAVFDNSLVQEKPSAIAGASILIAMQTSDDNEVSCADNSSFLVKVLSTEGGASRLSIVEEKLRAYLNDHSTTIEEIRASLNPVASFPKSRGSF